MAILSEHKEILLLQSKSKTLPQWYEFFNKQYTKKQIYSFCYRNQCQIKKISDAEKSKIQFNNAKKYNINQDYFKTWTHNMAYVLGFWFADGCIYGGKMFDITIHKKDKYILKKIAEELDYQGNLFDYVDRQASRLNFSCKVIYNDLINLGGTERKSLTLKFPNVPDEFLPDFIRGYFDGDGSIYNVKGKRINTAFCCGSQDFLISLLKILKEKINVQGGSFDSISMKLTFGKKDSIKLGNYIYQNNPHLFLLRKKEKFQPYLN